jgi:branched-chain amino acid transport system permease protein
MSRPPKLNRIGLATVVAALILLALPWVAANDFYINLASQILIYAVFALSINVLSGLGGLQSLGHGVYLGGAAYAYIIFIDAGLNAFTASVATLLCGVAAAAVFGVLALRAAGLGFLMITLALGQIVWGMAYRWISLTGGDNGLRLPARPSPFGIDLTAAVPFYYFTCIAFVIAFFCLWRLSQSPFGASLRGTRDQARRMGMLGHNVWMIRWLAILIAGFWGTAAGLLYVYYYQFVSPPVLALQKHAEVLLMAILGGVSAFTGPIVGAIIITLVKNLVSSYVERWNTLLGLIFVIVIMFMPDGLVPGCKRLWQRYRGDQRSGPP